MGARILVVDDERNIRRTLRMVLEGAGFETQEAESVPEAQQQLATHDFDLAILDVRLPGTSGVELLRQLRGRAETRSLPVLMISGHASIAEAVHAVQCGASDFFEKPLDRTRLLEGVRQALRSEQLAQRPSQPQQDLRRRYGMVGAGPSMRRLFAEIEKVAPTKGRVLITGESGTGKELVARAIHRLSKRCDGPFVRVNCAAIPSELIESELFGYERGAFTGAAGRKKGLFEAADGGTLFLDEIGDMGASAQAKVLRALQSGEISRVGSQTPLPVDVRVVTATNQDLEQAVLGGRFREDLFFRINVIPLRSPALRDHSEDIPALAQHFLEELCTESGIPAKPIDDEVMDELRARAWPGNVRELKNVVERMVILSGERITRKDLPPNGRLEAASAPPAANATWSPTGERLPLRDIRNQAEQDYIIKTLEECQWNISRAASLLGVERTNLHKKIRAFGIRRER